MKLQNIVFPPRNALLDELPMYYRSSEMFYYSETDQCYFLTKKDDVWFDTYFNAFSLAKWKKYTHLGNLKLSLTLQGNFYAELRGFSLSRKGIHHAKFFVNKYSLASLETITLEFPPSDCDIVFFKIKAISDVKIFSGAYCSDVSEENMNDVNISLVTCTFKREEYLEKNLRLLEKEIFEGGGEVAEHLSVKVVDNGKTLDKKDVELNDKIRLYPNKNCGGAGGFTRGMIETLRGGEQFSHVLLMDDDVIINVESIIRTYSLLKILKEEFKDAFIGGAMHRLDKKFIIHENIGVLTKSMDGFFPLKSNLDVRDIWSVLFNEKEEFFPNQYQAWWYCCIPLRLVSDADLPLPVFIRGDDIEYSVRKCKKIITLNGICIWHETSEFKPSNLNDCYFTFRSLFFLRLFYKKDKAAAILRSFQRNFRTLIFSYNYMGAESLLDAFEDYMRGYRFFEENDPEKVMQRQRIKNEEWTNLENFCDIEELFANSTLYYGHLFDEKKANFFKRLMIRVTLGGALIPDIFFKTSTGFLRAGLVYNPKQTFLRRSILAINQTTDKAVLRPFCRKKMASLYLRCWRLSFKYLTCHKLLRKEWQENVKKVTNIVLWSKILELENRTQ
jgi:GT2 family glycosyltransferase